MSRKPKINPNPYNLDFYWKATDKSKVEVTSKIKLLLGNVPPENQDVVLEYIKELWDAAVEEGYYKGSEEGYTTGRYEGDVFGDSLY